MLLEAIITDANIDIFDEVATKLGGTIETLILSRHAATSVSSILLRRYI